MTHRPYPSPVRALAQHEQHTRPTPALALVAAVQGGRPPGRVVLAPTSDPETGINAAVAEALDAIGDDEEYAAARRELLAAQEALADGTTAQVHVHLMEGLRLVDATCPIQLAPSAPGSGT